MFENLRIKLRSLVNSKIYLGRLLYSLILPLWLAYKFIVNPRYRYEQISKFRYSKKIIQVSTYTAENRYPILFQSLAKELLQIKKP